jgi:hypothetical protein
MFDVDWGLESPASAILPPGQRTLGHLIEEYKADRVSGYRKLRYATRVNHDNIMVRMVAAYGHLRLSEIKARTLHEMHLHWSQDGKKLAMAHSFMAKLRALVGYGASFLDDPDCTRLCVALGHRRDAQAGEKNQEYLTYEQAVAIRNMAREIGYFSIALAQAMQFETLIRQKDAIGEWVPLSEPGDGAVALGDKKWQRGIIWEEINQDLILDHVTSKKQKRLVIPLHLSPMTMEEFWHVPDWQHDAGGPVIVCEYTSYPWDPSDFRRRWRTIADLCGVPKSVKQMHSRSGGISEGIKLGVPMEFMRHAALHSDLQTTAGYDRAKDELAAEALRRRVAGRNAEVAA